MHERGIQTDSSGNCKSIWRWQIVHNNILVNALGRGFTETRCTSRYYCYRILQNKKGKMTSKLLNSFGNLSDYSVSNLIIHLIEFRTNLSHCCLLLPSSKWHWNDTGVYREVMSIKTICVDAVADTHSTDLTVPEQKCQRIFIYVISYGRQIDIGNQQRMECVHPRWNIVFTEVWKWNN